MSDPTSSSVIGRILFASPKAIHILLEDGTDHWIPKSIITNLDEIQESDTELEQEFEVQLWLLQKKGLEGY